MRWFFYVPPLAIASFCLVLASTIQGWPTANSQGMLLDDEKRRLGSTPPSCHNRCSECNPCIAVQVPVIPVHNNAKLGTANSTPEDMQLSSTAAEYSNYKPIGWKCQCGGHLFNP